MRFLRKLIALVVLVAVCLLAYEVKDIYKDAGKNIDEQGTSTKNESSTNENSDDEKTDDKHIVDSDGLSLLVLGENFMHDSVIQSGKQSDGSYNYDYIFEGIKSYIDNSDLNIINQGSVIGGNSLGVSGYPSFNAPEEICTAMQKAGIDVALMANSRINSMGTAAIRNCLNIWSEKAPNVNIAGINDSKENAQDILVVEVNGIRVAILNYTYNVNEAISVEDLYMVDFLCTVNETTGAVIENQLSAKVIDDIKRAEKTSDFVIVCPYWGEEYSYEVSSLQKEMAKQMTEAGADLIIGTHPHYLEDVEWITSDNGNKSLCYYSLGNYISSQNYTGAMLGGLASVKLKVDNGVVVIDEVNTGLIPVVTQYTFDGSEPANVVGVIPYSEYTEELANEHGIKERGSVSFSKSELQYILNTYIDSKFIK